MIYATQRSCAAKITLLIIARSKGTTCPGPLTTNAKGSVNMSFSPFQLTCASLGHVAPCLHLLTAPFLPTNSTGHAAGFPTGAYLAKCPPWPLELILLKAEPLWSSHKRL